MKHDLALRSRIAYFKSDGVMTPQDSFEFIEDGVILIDGGKIRDIGHTTDFLRRGLDLSTCEHLPDQLIVSGFVDSHVHAPQIDVMASYGEQLLDWLEKYTFPAELKFSEPDYSRAQTQRFCRGLLSNGVTTAMVFTTSFKHSTDHLFETASALDMRVIAGKVMMDRNAPQALRDTASQSKQDNEILIEKWHKHGRLGYALTPRFSGTSTPTQLQMAGETLKRHPDLWVQTHLSENLSEVAWTQQLFPEAKDYLNTYENFGLVGEKTIFAHCLYLSEFEIERLAISGAGIAFCPSSNMFLGSGLFEYSNLQEKNIPISLASDIGAGTSLSPFRTMGDAYKVCQLQGYAMSALEAFYLTSLGGARALGLDDKIGSLSPGFEADFLVLNPLNIQYLDERLDTCKSIEEELFVYMTLGDERLIERTYIAGKKQYQHGVAHSGVGI